MNKGYDGAPHSDASFRVPFICMGTVIRLFFPFPLSLFSQLRASNLIKRVFCMCNWQTILKQAFHQSYWSLAFQAFPHSLLSGLLSFGPHWFHLGSTFLGHCNEFELTIFQLFM